MASAWCRNGCERCRFANLGFGPITWVIEGHHSNNSAIPAFLEMSLNSRVSFLYSLKYGKDQTPSRPLAALAQDNRLDVYRLLVQAGPDGNAGRRRSPTH